MNTKTPLVQKLILLMLVLIFGVLVLILVKERKQIESLNNGNGQAVAISTNPEQPANVRKAFPSLRSSKAPPRARIPEPEPDKPQPQPAAAPTPAKVKAPVAVAVQPPPTILPAGTVVEDPPEALSDFKGVSGRVALIGTPPPEKTIKFDQTCGAMHPGTVTTRHFVVAPGGGLANVLVYISRGTEGRQFPTQPPVVLDQKDCMYQPYVLGAMVNQPIQFKNSDPFLHNVHALPRRVENREFNFAQPVQDQVDSRIFSTPEVFVKIKCEVHDWMFAYVGVVNNPYFAVTDTNGFFQLPTGLPPGQYEVTASHLKAGSMTQRFTYKKDTNVRLEFKLRADGQNSRAIALHP